MTATNPPLPPMRQCDNCRVNLRVERKGQYVPMYVCPKCGASLIDPPRSPGAS